MCDHTTMGCNVSKAHCTCGRTHGSQTPGVPRHTRSPRPPKTVGRRGLRSPKMLQIQRKILNAAKRHNHRLSSMNESEESQLSRRTAGTLTSQERRPQHLSMHNNGHFKNLTQELHLRKLDGFLHNSHTQDCWNLSLHFHSSGNHEQHLRDPHGLLRSLHCGVHVSAAHMRSEYSVDGLDLRHHPEEHLGLLEHGLQDYRDVHNGGNLFHKTLLNPVQREDLEDLHEELAPSPPPPLRYRPNW